MNLFSSSREIKAFEKVFTRTNRYFDVGSKELYLFFNNVVGNETTAVDYCISFNATNFVSFCNWRYYDRLFLTLIAI